MHSGIDCHKRDGTTCDGPWPFELQGDNVPSQWPRPFFNETEVGTFQMATSNFSTAWFDAVDQEVWIPSVYQLATATGVEAEVGFTCISVADVTTVNKFCGGTGDSAFVSGGAGSEVNYTDNCGADQLFDCNQGLAASGSRLFTWNVKTGDIICIDIRLSAGAGGPCATGGVIDFGPNLPNASREAQRFASIGAWDGRIYGGTTESSAPAYGFCIVALTGQACPGWTNPQVIPIGTSRFAQLPGLTAQSPARGACFLGVYYDQGNITAANCYNAAGADISNTLTAAFKSGYQNGGDGMYTDFNPTYGTRMYWAAGGGGSGIHCWDFALNNWCTNWTAAGITDTNYQVSLDPLKPTCIWSNADDGVIETYDAITGAAGNCAVPAATVTFDGGLVLPRMSCTSLNAIQAWRSFTVNTASIYTSATFTVNNSAGVAIPAWTNVAIPGSKIVDLTTLQVADTGQHPTFTITFTGRQTDGDVSARISAIGGSPELCLRPMIACPNATVLHPTQLGIGSLTATATGSTTAGSVVSQFDPVVQTINLAATPESACATSLSGTLTTGAGAAVPGVAVVLVDPSGAPMNYPADYPTVALRNQPITTTSDSAGGYSFPLLSPGDYKVKFVDASAGVVVNIASISASGSGMTSDYTSATSLNSPTISLALGTPGVIDAKYNSSQLLTKAFFPPIVSAGQVSTLVFTLTKPAAAAKTGIGFVDTLPTGLVIDAFPNRRTNCPSGGSNQTADPSQMTATAGGTSVTVAGVDLPSGAVTCTFSVSVKATGAGDYLNGMSNVTTTNIDKSTNATVTVVPASTTGASVCDSNMFYIESGQLYRQSPSNIARYPVGPLNQSGGLGPIGYNSVDGHLYAIASSSFTSNGVSITAGHLVKISGAGILTDLGAVTGANVDMSRMDGGDFDNSGNFVVKWWPFNVLYSINVSTLVATEISLSADMYGNDMSYSNGSFYSASGLDVYRAVVSAGTSWTVSTQSIFPTNYAPGNSSFTDGQGRAIFVDGNGDAYSVSNISTASSSSDFTLLYHYVYSPSDGAMCHGAPLPLAAPDTTAGPKNVAQTKNLLTNDSAPLNVKGITLNSSSVKLCDPNANPAETAPNCTKGNGTTITVASVGTYGVDGAGVVTFTPVNEYTGTPPTIGYQVADSNGNIASSTYAPKILSGGPTATNDVSTGAYDTNQVITVLTNDTPSAGETLTPTSVKLCATTSTADASCTLPSLTVAGEGTYTVNAAGTITFDPLPSFTGNASPVKYVVADSTTLLGSATVVATVGTPNAPVATPQTKNVAAGASVAFTTVTGASGLATSAAGFDTSATCLITPASSPAACDADGIVAITGEGTFTLNQSTGVVTYAADAGATQGNKTAITYQVQDVTGQKATSTLTPIIPAPLTAANDVSTGAYDTNQIISVLTNDVAGAGATLTPSSVKLCATTATANSSCTLPTLTVVGEGTYTANANGTVTFDPLPPFKGTATPVKYVVADSTSQLVGATITSTVSAPAAPVATANAKTVFAGASVSFTTITGASGLATAAAGFNTAATCLITPASSPAACDADGIVAIAGEGTYTLNQSTGVVTYAADVAATQGAKTAITYQVEDVTGQKATSTLTPTIPAAPVAVNDTSTGAFDTNQVISVLTNDTVVSPVTFVATSVKLCATTATANSSCTLPTLTVTGEGTYTANANGTVTFDPLPTFKGNAAPVKYAVTDSTGQLAGANITPTVSDPAPPAATPDAKAVVPGGTVAFTTISGASGLATAVAGLNTAATCLITPASNPDACDADSVVTVAGVGVYTLNVATGVVTLVADAAATQGTKTPLKYQVEDIFGQKATSTLTPTIPAPPSATADTSSGAFDTNQVISVLTNDTVVSPVTFVATSVKLCATTATANSSCTLPTLTVVGEGTYTVNASGTVTFDPLPTFKGTAAPVKYAVTDSTGQLAGATITPTVSDPAPPVATPDAKAVVPGGAVAFTTISGASGLATAVAGLNTAATCLITPASNPDACDADGVVTVAGVGVYTLNVATGVVTLVADASATQGSKTPLKYQVEDVFGQKSTSTLTPTIPAPPSATADTSSGAFDTNQVIVVLTNDTVVSPVTFVASTVKLCATTATANSSCTLSTLTIAGEGTYTANANGTITFDPLPTFVGSASPVKYVVADSTSQLAGATITSTVANPSAPSATADAPATGNFDVTQTISLVANDTPGSPSLPLLGSTIKLCPLNATAPFTSTNCSSVPTQSAPLVTADGSYWLDPVTGDLTFDPLATFTGTVTQPVRYIVRDALNQTATATVTFSVASPAGPAATPETKVVAPGTSVSFTNVIGTNALATGVGLKSGAAQGPCIVNPSTTVCGTSVTISGEGTWTIDQTTGIATFTALSAITVGTKTPVTYKVTDALGQTATSTFTPIVPSPPVVTNDEKSGERDVNQTFSPFANDTFATNSPVVLSSLKLCGSGETPGGCTRTILVVASEGTYTVNTDGTITFDPLPTFSGTASPVIYQASDLAGNLAHATITATVNASPIPEPKNDEAVGNKGSSIEFSPWLNDAAGTAPNNEKVTIDPKSIRLCGSGEVIPNCSQTSLTTADGKYTVDVKTGKVKFVPRSGLTGTVTQPVTYQIANDWKGGSGPGVASGQLIATIRTTKLPTTGTSPFWPVVWAGVTLLLGCVLRNRNGGFFKNG
jgi:CshA-type fibril repeat protein